MSLDALINDYYPSIENALNQTVALTKGNGLDELHSMMAYHLGWIGEGAGPAATGKRIRPILVLLSTQAAGGNWKNALPAATAVELIHNFSLIHDDIEDNSHLRRGRPTLWTKWGVPQAINTGDAMFTLAHMAIMDIEKTTNMRITIEAVKTLQKTCLRLTQGQHLDIAYEDQQELTVDSYWPMIQGKTAALISACTEIGAIVADIGEIKLDAYRRFGQNLGLVFQLVDDILGIWGDTLKIGKSNASDLVAGKKSLPVLYGLAQNGDFSRRWLSGPILPDEVPELANQLEAEGARDYAQNEADRLTESALHALQQAQPIGKAGLALTQLAHQLLYREI